MAEQRNMSSFDEVERRSKLAVMPKSISHGKVLYLRLLHDAHYLGGQNSSKTIANS